MSGGEGRHPGEGDEGGSASDSGVLGHQSTVAGADGDGLRVVEVRERFVVVVKPAGLSSVPGLTPWSQDNVWTRVSELLPEASGPMICHRLDAATSGLMVLGLDADAHRQLSLQFQRRTVSKRYECLVEGAPEADGGVIELPLRPDFVHRPWQMVDRYRGKPSTSRYGVLEHGERASRLWMEPVTGRTHQLRIHASHPAEDGGLGCPMLGDELYGDPRTAGRLCLHAVELSFAEPGTGERVSYRDEAPFKISGLEKG